MQGRFFTAMWGGSTTDLDVRDLLYAYSPVLWDGELGRFRFDRSVTNDVLIMNDGEGNRVYLLALADDLLWSDGTPVTAGDYAFSVLLQMDPAVAETGGKPADYSWLAGSDEYLDGTAKTVSGLRIITDNMLQITMKAESLPYFYELNRLNIRPYPIAEIAPGTAAADDGEGAYLTRPLTADLLRETVLDEKIGYLSHPRTVSGPYVLASFDGETARFAVNPYYKGNEDGMIPRIGRLKYTTAVNEEMISKLVSGEFGLLNKVTEADAVQQGLALQRNEPGSFAMDCEARTGLTVLWYMESSPKVQEKAVRQAIAFCFDRDRFTAEYAGESGVRMDAFCGIGQWMYRDVSLDSVKKYRKNAEEAVRLLEEAGWTLNEAGEAFDDGKDPVRYKKTGEGLVGLNLVLAIPEENAEAEKELDAYLTETLREAGIALSMKKMPLKEIQDAYEGLTKNEADLMYLGENFTITVEPEILAPRENDTALSAEKEEILTLAKDMVRTEPEDLAGYARKWLKLQERILEELPLLPVYSNTYFDFFTRKLHGYRVTDSVTMGDAIVPAYMSDAEELSEEEAKKAEERLAEFAPDQE